MNKRRNIFIALIVAAIFSVTASAGFAGPNDGKTTYEVTITNLTRGQIFSPPVVVVHNNQFRLFVPGQAASDELAALAEDAAADELVEMLMNSANVGDYAFEPENGNGVIAPGDSKTLRVESRGTFLYISLASMLVTTNDAFTGIRNHRVPLSGVETMYALAYDAGSEGNSELCAFIPGPPCGNGGVRDTEMAEGFIHVHAGISGIGDLMPENHDWRNPVALIEIRPIFGFDS